VEEDTGGVVVPVEEDLVEGPEVAVEDLVLDEEAVDDLVGAVVPVEEEEETGGVGVDAPLSPTVMVGLASNRACPVVRSPLNSGTVGYPGALTTSILGPVIVPAVL
jgi:hypothetical protein